MWIFLTCLITSQSTNMNITWSFGSTATCRTRPWKCSTFVEGPLDLPLQTPPPKDTDLRGNLSTQVHQLREPVLNPLFHVLRGGRDGRRDRFGGFCIHAGFACRRLLCLGREIGSGHHLRFWDGQPIAGILTLAFAAEAGYLNRRVCGCRWNG